MKNKGKIIFWIGAIITLIFGIYGVYGFFATGPDEPTLRNMYAIEGFILIIIAIFCTTILIGLPFLNKEK